MMRVCGAADPMPMGRTESLPPEAESDVEEDVVDLEEVVDRVTNAKEG